MEENKGTWLTATLKSVKIEKQGTNNNGKWTLFDLEFESKDKIVNLNAFDSVGKNGKGKKIEELEINKLYSIGYNVKNPNQKGTIYWIDLFKPKVKQTNTIEKKTIVNSEVSTDFMIGKLKTNSNTFDTFCDIYTEQMTRTKQTINMNHFIGSFCVHFDSDIGKEFVQFLKDMYEQKVETKIQIDMYSQEDLSL